MNIEFIAITLDVAGKIMVAYTALRVHWRFRKEHQVDEIVFSTMKREQFIGLTGIGFMIAGYLLKLPAVF